MRPASFIVAIVLLLGTYSTAASAQTGAGAVRGTAVDVSGALLPGVAIVAASTDGRVLATTVTDEVGGYLFKALPAGRVDLTFHLEGFATSVRRVAVQQGVESLLVERLDLARLAETVVVRGSLPADEPPPPPPPPSPPPPRLVVKPVPSHDLASVCGPAKASAIPESLGTIRSRRQEALKGLYGAGDELIIDGGTFNGLEAGQNLVVRRHYRVSGLPGAVATGEHTSGLLQIVEAEEHVSTAVVVYACDEMMRGDYLALFKPEPVRVPDPVGIPIYEEAARILFADDGQIMGVSRRLMVIDRGSDQGIRAGQRLTLFRRQRPGDFTPAVIGDGVVVAVQSDSATIRVEGVTDAIVSGDWAAPQRQQAAQGRPPAEAPVAASDGSPLP